MEANDVALMTVGDLAETELEPQTWLEDQPDQPTPQQQSLTILGAKIDNTGPTYIRNPGRYSTGPPTLGAVVSLRGVVAREAWPVA